MHHRAMFVAVVAATAAAAHACTPFDTTGGSDATDAAPDTEVEAAADAAVLDGAIDVADASRADDARCVSPGLAPDGSFCDDFDAPTLREFWVPALAPADAGTLTIFAAAGAPSSPNVLRSELRSYASGTTSASLSFSAPANTNAACSLQIKPTIPATAFDRLAVLTLLIGGRAGRELIVYSTGGKLTAQLKDIGGDGGFTDTRDGTPTPLLVNAWRNIRLAVGPTSATVSYGGQSVMSEMLTTAVFDTTSLEIGLSNPTPDPTLASVALYDDVRCTLLP